MPCNHSFIEQYLDACLENTLNDEQESQLSSTLTECEHCCNVLARAKQFHEYQQEWQVKTPGNWNRRLFPMRPARSISSFWHWGALATASFALVLVVLNTHISVNDGLHITLGQPGAAGTLQLLESELVQAREESLLATQTLLQDFVVRQNQQQRYALNAVLEQSRIERNEELNLLYSSWLNQRQNDQQNISQRFGLLTDNQIESNQYLNNLARTVSTTPVR